MTTSVTSVTINAFNGEINATVTNSGNVVRYWISNTLRINRDHMHHLVIGLDMKWCPSGQYGTQGENPISMLQLCVGRRCLIFQLLHSDHIPDDLKNFLLDNRFRFVGVNMRPRLEKLYREYNLRVGNSYDLRELAAWTTCQPEMRQCGLADLARVMGVNVHRPRSTTVSNWASRQLDRHQIELAAVDSYVMFDVGLRLNVGNFRV